MKSIRHFLYLGLTFLALSCSNTIEEPIGLDLDFQPLETGIFWIYEVNETLYFGAGDAVQSDYFFRDRVDNSFENEEGVMVYRIIRSRSQDGNNWANDLVYTYQIEKNTLIRKSENQVEVLLVFPPQVGQRWDGRVYDANEEDMFEITERETSTDPAFSQAATVKVLQSEEDDAITFRDNRYLVFAKGIGMVENFEEVLQYCSRNECLGEQIIEEGRFRHLRLSEYGKE